MILVSACLAGVKCKYHGGDNMVDAIAQMVKDGVAIPVCPEELGGLPTPREPVDIESGDGYAAINGEARLLCENGQEVTTEFLEGAIKVLQIAREEGIILAILKEKSPSCGSNIIYNRVQGNSAKVERELVKGMGVTAALLAKNNIQVISEEEFLENSSARLVGLK